MAKKKKKRKAAKPAKGKRPAAKAKKTKKAKKSKKAVARKASKPLAKKAKRPVAKKRPAKKARKTKDVIGEGNYTASREFRKDEEAFVRANRSRIPQMGKAAEAALEGPEGDDLRQAENEARSHARD